MKKQILTVAFGVISIGIGMLFNGIIGAIVFAVFYTAQFGLRTD